MGLGGQEILGILWGKKRFLGGDGLGGAGESKGARGERAGGEVEKEEKSGWIFVF